MWNRKIQEWSLGRAQERPLNKQHINNGVAQVFLIALGKSLEYYRTGVALYFEVRK